MGFVANFIRFPTVQKSWKSVKIWLSYREFKGGNFFVTKYICEYLKAVVGLGDSLFVPSVCRAGYRCTGTYHQYYAIVLRLVWLHTVFAYILKYLSRFVTLFWNTMRFWNTWRHSEVQENSTYILYFRISTSTSESRQILQNIGEYCVPP